MEMNEDLRALIQKEIDHYFRNHMEDLAKHFTAELTNENGNSSVKQSGNGIVYVDNTGIAYAMALFFYHFMSDQFQKNINLEDILARLDEHIGENRKMFEEAIQSLTDTE
ncbi:MAG: hypothetical protein H0Z32_03545 [Bacillaceae bacterium]|nr:hypothetical protein [Bacillaceae bacterium]